VRGTHGTVVNTVPFSGEIPTKLEGRQAIWMSIASGNVNPDVLLKVAARTCTQHGLDVYRAHIDVVDDNTVQGVPADRALTKDAPFDSVTQLRLLLSPAEGITSLSEADIETLTRDIRRAKWLGDEVADLSNFDTSGAGMILGTDRAEVIVALTTMLHGPLVKTTAGEGFGSPASIVDLLKSQPNIWMRLASQIADLFLHKFNPHDPLSQQDFDARHDAIHQKIERLNAANAKKVLGEMLKASKMTLRTNFYNNERYALSLRVDPRILASGSIGVDPKTPLPFGVFFMKGRNFSGFHCRFRDIARGGLRIVTPGSSDQMNIESTRHFDEVYNLSLAQQLKNKDIPEGGSKAVVLVDAPAVGKNNTFAAARTSVKAFTDSLLDLIVEDSVSNCVDYLNKDELIYLGPDEQVIPEDIEWICNRAGQRGYPIPAAFMSSKARNGINHKVYGVTSEGVVVHLKTALEEHLKIDPKKEQFTVKVTGGPDGDVAGNFFKIMNRDFPDTCKILGIADGFGVAEDPEV
jgi:glutamate dehydrogenase